MGVALAPADIAKAALYFSCEDSAGVTGTSLVVDGGYLAAAEWEHPGHTQVYGSVVMPPTQVENETKQSEWRLASADFTFPLLPHDKVLDLISALELNGIDIGLFEGRSHLWPSREFNDLSRSAKTLRDKLTDRGLAPADVFLQLDPDFVPYAINQPDARTTATCPRAVSAHARIRQRTRLAARNDAARRLL